MLLYVPAKTKVTEVRKEVFVENLKIEEGRATL